MTRVFITGVGVNSPYGHSFQLFSDGILNGVSMISPITRFDTTPLPYHLGAETADPPRVDGVSVKDWHRMDRSSKMALDTVSQAMVQAQVTPGELNPLAWGCMVGSTLGGMDNGARYYQKWLAHRHGYAAHLLDYPMYACTSHVSQRYGFKGTNTVISTACSSSLVALGLAADYIRSGRYDGMVVCGIDVLLPLTWAGFGILRNMTTSVPRPFDKHRNGLVLGEGCVSVIIESEAHLNRRTQRPLAEVLGYAVTSDAYHMTAPDITGQGAAEAMSRAIQSSGMVPDDIHYIQAHGTGTVHNDAMEVRAVRRVFGSEGKGPPISSVKSMIGHTLGASGLFGVLTGLVAMANQALPPTAHYETLDPNCDWDVVPNHQRPAAVKTVLVNAFGFGGSNAALVLKKVERKDPT